MKSATVVASKSIVYSWSPNSTVSSELTNVFLLSSNTGTDSSLSLEGVSITFLLSSVVTLTESAFSVVFHKNSSIVFGLIPALSIIVL